MVDSQILIADRDQQFNDWAKLVTFREVSQTYDPETMQISETFTDTSLQAIIGTRPFVSQGVTADQYLSEDLKIQLKAEELPGVHPASTCRIVYLGNEYQVHRFELSNQGHVYVLECRKRS